MLPFADISQEVNRRLKHTYIHIEPDGGILLKTPRRLSVPEVNAIVRQKAAWITRARQRMQQRFSNRLDADTPSLFVWGEKLAVRYEPTPHETPLERCGDALVYKAPHFCRHTLHTLSDAFYAAEAKRVLAPVAERYAETMGLFPQAVRFSKTKRQWGSCSAANRISLNTMLAKVPLELAEYVIVHELAHIKHKHHQAAFWELVASVMPDYRERRAELKRYTTY